MPRSTPVLTLLTLTAALVLWLPTGARAWVFQPRNPDRPKLFKPAKDKAESPATTPASDAPVPPAAQSARLLGTGTFGYTARVVHSDRQFMSHVRGTIDLSSGDFTEEATTSYLLDFKVMPGRLEPAPQAMPSIWRVGGTPAQRFGSLTESMGLPTFGSALLRHFVVGQVIADPEGIKAHSNYISQQLEVESADLSDTGFEYVCRYRGAPLVVVGSRQVVDGHLVPKDLAVLGPSGELYQYFFEEFTFSPTRPSPAISLPTLEPSNYVAFPAGGAQEVPVRQVKDWLIFQATLSSGRQVNLLLDSGSDTLIFDDTILSLDAGLQSVGETAVEGPLASGRMKLYEGLSLNIGGVQFSNLPAVGGSLSSVGVGSGLRIHGIVGSELLQLCRCDIDLVNGKMRLEPRDTVAKPDGQPLQLTFINDFPHLEAEVAGKGKALMLLDTGQRAALSVNLDTLQTYKMDDDLVMDGFLGDITGGLLPRYMLDRMEFKIAGATYQERGIDAAPELTYSYNGTPVIGSIGFAMLAKHFGGITLDYHNKYMYVRGQSEQRNFAPASQDWLSWAPKRFSESGLGLEIANDSLRRRKRMLDAAKGVKRDSELLMALAPPEESAPPAKDAGAAKPAGGAAAPSKAGEQPTPSQEAEAAKAKAARDIGAGKTPQPLGGGADQTEHLGPMKIKPGSRNNSAASRKELSSGELWGGRVLEDSAPKSTSSLHEDEVDRSTWLQKVQALGLKMALALAGALVRL